MKAELKKTVQGSVYFTLYAETEVEKERLRELDEQTKAGSRVIHEYGGCQITDNDGFVQVSSLSFIARPGTPLKEERAPIIRKRRFWDLFRKS